MIKEGEENKMIDIIRNSGIPMMPYHKVIRDSKIT